MDRDADLRRALRERDVPRRRKSSLSPHHDRSDAEEGKKRRKKRKKSRERRKEKHKESKKRKTVPMKHRRDKSSRT